MGVNGIWKSSAAGLCGSAAHSGLMFLKSWMGWLPSFHPYENLQQMLSHLVGSSVHPVVPWALSFLNGAVVLGILFGRLYRMLPGRSGAVRGLVFGVFGWIAVGVLLFPMLDQGLFAARAGLGAAPGPVLARDDFDLQHHHGDCLFRAEPGKARQNLNGKRQVNITAQIEFLRQRDFPIFALEFSR